MFKKLGQILAVLMVFALLTGCVAPAAPVQQPVADQVPAEEPAADESAAEPEDKGEIVFIPKSTSATFYLFLVKGAQDKANELGYTVDYLGPATEADIAAQVDLVRNVTKKKPAGILLAALDSEALIPAVEEAMAAGVPVAMADSGINSDSPLASIITDQYEGGWMAGEEMARLLGEKGLVSNLGIQAGSVSAGRSVGFAEAIAQYPEMSVLETQWTDADAVKSLNIATDQLTANPDLVGFFSAAAPIAAGIAQAAKAKGVDKELKIITFDPSPEILPLFDDGTIQAIIAQDPYQMGYEGVAAIHAFINGETIENPSVELAPVLITPENVDSDVVQALLQTPDKFEK
ncbi:MAG: substrate-binding domain-containing protein [Chloroflexota bacterium]|nr:substrate-binding domain-containing protein [Chloroflexota bacterium]